MKLDSQRAREIGRLGGIASAQAKKSQRGMRQTLLTLLASDQNILSDASPAPLTAGEALARGLIRQAVEGNIKAAEFIRDTVGEKPGKPPADTSDKSQTHEIRIRVVE